MLGWCDTDFTHGSAISRYNGNIHGENQINIFALDSVKSHEDLDIVCCGPVVFSDYLSSGQERM